MTLRTARQGFFKTFVASLVVHLLLIAAGLFIYRPGAKRTFIAPVYTVDLVDPGALGQGVVAGTEANETKGRVSEPPKAAVKEAREVRPREKTRVNLKGGPDSKDRDAARAGPIERASVDAALKRIARSVERKEEKALVSSSIEGIKAKKSSGAFSKEVEEIKRAVAGKAVGGGANGAAGLKAGPSGGGITRSSIEEARLLAYYTAVVDRVQREWYVSGESVGRGASVVVSVKIGKKGEILECFIERSSGSRSFDESLVSAVKKAAPFPPLPEGFEGEFLDTGLRYCPGCGE
jgi:TonB family protein